MESVVRIMLLISNFFTLSKAKAAIILPKAKQATNVEINFLHKSGSVISAMKGKMNSIGVRDLNNPSR